MSRKFYSAYLSAVTGISKTKNESDERWNIGAEEIIEKSGDN